MPITVSDILHLQPMSRRYPVDPTLMQLRINELERENQYLTWQVQGKEIDKNTLIKRVSDLEHDLNNVRQAAILLMERIKIVNPNLVHPV
jgi:FtsZ-binding cell division protein ZapB